MAGMTLRQIRRLGLGFAVSVAGIAATACDITEPSGIDEVRGKADLARQIIDRYLVLTADSDLRLVLLEGSPFAVLEGNFSPGVAELYERLGATEPFVSGYVEVLRDLGLEEEQVLAVLAEEQRTDALGSAALDATGRAVIDLEDPAFFASWASAVSANDTWERREEQLGYRFAGLQIGAPVEVMEPRLTLVPYTSLCGQGCGSGHIAVFVAQPLRGPVLREVRTAWVGYP